LHRGGSEKKRRTDVEHRQDHRGRRVVSRTAVREASRTVRGITGVDVQDWTARVEDGELVNYKVNVKIAFGIEGEGGDYADGGDRTDTSEKKRRKGRKNR
jgi:flavin-binding protein dodecin